MATDLQADNGGTMTLADVKGHIQIIQEVLRGCMKKNVHYGVIPGTKGKPSLWKPGAELIFTTFRLGTEPTIEELGEGYRVSVRVFHIPSGQTVGYGMGSCSWGEEKYAWRSCSPAEYAASNPANTREKFGRDGRTYQQVRTNPCDLQNTVLKMAIKRARVDACLTCTAASDVFDQDIEDLGNGNGNGGERQNTGAKADAPRADELDDVKMLKAIEGAKNVDELVVIFDQINAITSAKLKVNMMGAYRTRLAELEAGNE